MARQSRTNEYDRRDRRQPAPAPAAPTELTSGQRVAKGVIWCANFAVDLVVIMIVAILVGFGVYSIWDTQQIYAVADSSVYETYRPGAGEEDSPSFAELQAINPDVLGWISVYGTGIDYPVVQGEDNDEYMNATATGEFSLGGAIFLDCTNAADFTDFNTIIYGHHMEQSQMFGDIDLFDDEDYFQSHRYGNLYYGGRNHGLEFYTMIDADAYDFQLYNPQVTDNQAYLDYLRSICRYWRDESAVTANDHIVMLSTCASTATNGRYVLFGVIRDETYEDTFITEPTIVQRTLRTATTEGSMPIHYLVIAIIIVAILLILALVLARLNKARVERNRRNEARRAERDERRRD